MAWYLESFCSYLAGVSIYLVMHAGSPAERTAYLTHPSYLPTALTMALFQNTIERYARDATR